MITIYESSETFRHLCLINEERRVKEGDIFTASNEYSRGMQMEEGVQLIIDNSIPFGKYKIADENGFVMKEY